MIRTGGRCSWPYRLPGSRGAERDSRGIPGDTDPERGTIRSLVFRQGGEYGAPYHPGGLGGLDG